ncbi:chorismate lyase [Legionella sp. km772]|uniref:chorismate--pyruvate lyase family protein n=1 Tax=Legionella sp. km772 TaxID=2498111 RepID=UPI000F8CCD75|nr:chorismate lyase [Legionella sp. km772]RUR12178.1 chorismate lyase [Legionella sp. km772]
MSILSSFLSTKSTDAPEALRAWLYCNQPLTDKLKNLSGEAQLEVLSQGWTTSQWWDKKNLSIEEKIFQREILMKSHGEVYWYARSIIPKSCYDQAPDFFKRLEKESIRRLIFDEPKVKLMKRIVYPINEHAIEFDWMKHYLPHIKDSFWVRLAEFIFQDQSRFYLIEILFPKLGDLRT